MPCVSWINSGETLQSVGSIGGQYLRNDVLQWHELTFSNSYKWSVASVVHFCIHGKYVCRSRVRWPLTSCTHCPIESNWLLLDFPCGVMHLGKEMRGCSGDEGSFDQLGPTVFVRFSMWSHAPRETDAWMQWRQWKFCQTGSNWVLLNFLCGVMRVGKEMRDYLL